MTKPTSRLRYVRLSGAAVHVPDGVDPATVPVPVPPHVSVAQQRRWNRMGYRRLGVRIHCQARGCRERIAELRFGTSGGGVPTFVLAIHSPWITEPVTDPDVRTRFRLTGAFDPEVSSVYHEFSHGQPGSRVEIICRRGHLSELGLAALTAAVRRASVSPEAG